MNETLKTLPHSLEAEQGVLGSILLDAQYEETTRILDLCLSNGITEHSFYDPRNKILFKTLQEMSQESIPLDALTLLDKLRAEQNLDTIGGVKTIDELISGTATSAHAEYYIDVLRRCFLMRTMILCARETEKKCFDPAQLENADVLLGEVEKNFLEINRSGSVRKDWKTTLENSYSLVRAHFDGPQRFDGLPTGFRFLDEKILGLKGGDMIVLAARPSVGKTSLAMNIAECLALGRDIENNPMKGNHNREHPVLIFSLEMSAESLATRMLSGRAGVNLWRLQRGLLTNAERTMQLELLQQASHDLSSAEIYIDDTSALDIADIRARARRMKRAKGIELVVIDYLQLSNCREYSKQGRQLETGRISGQIKAMAKELNVPVIVLSQLSRATEKDGSTDEIPRLSHLRDSGSIEQDADMVFLLRRPSRTLKGEWHDDAPLAILDVAKNRNGETGEVDFNFDRETTRFYNRPPNTRGTPQNIIPTLMRSSLPPTTQKPTQPAQKPLEPPHIESLTDDIEL